VLAPEMNDEERQALSRSSQVLREAVAGLRAATAAP
jgi:hypothetical protein